MISWVKRALSRRAQSKRPVSLRKSYARFTLESLEDRITPTTTLAPPTLLAPTAAIRVDQSAYTINLRFA